MDCYRMKTRVRGLTAFAFLLLALAAAGCGSGGLSGSDDRGTGTGNSGQGGAGNTPSGNWDIQIVDEEGTAGYHATLRQTGRGTAAIAYYETSGTTFPIRYARFDGWRWDIETVHTSDTLAGCAMAMNPSGNPVMAFIGGEAQPLFYWAFQSDLLLTRWNGGGWDTEAVDEEGVVGLWPSVAYDRFGRPGISYQDLGTGIDYRDFHLRDLKYAAWTGQGWAPETVEEDGGGYYTQLVFNAAGQPAIAYCGNPDGQSQAVKLALRGDYGWELHTLDTTGGCSEASLSLQVKPDGGFGMVYYDNRYQDLKYAAYREGFWQIEEVETHNKVGKYCSLDYTSDGEAVVAYYYCGRSTDSDCQGGGDLRFARRTDTGWQIESVETEGNTGLFTSLTVVTPDDQIQIAYHDHTLGALKWATRR